MSNMLLKVSFLSALAAILLAGRYAIREEVMTTRFTVSELFAADSALSVLSIAGRK